MKRQKRSKIWKIEKDELQSILDESKSYVEVLEKLGFDGYNGNHRTLKERLNNGEFNLNKLNENRQNEMKSKLSFLHKREDLSSVLVGGGKFCRRTLKKRLVEENHLKYKCDRCGLGDIWEGEEIVLQLDHKNGINDDNRLENLRFLCPNCHSQTKTFGGKNCKKYNICDECNGECFRKSKICAKCRSKRTRKVERPDIEVLKKDIEELGYCGTGRKYGVTDNAIRKWLKVK